MILQKIGEFDELNESFENYIERFEMYLYINKIDDDKEKSNFLIAISGPTLYAIMKSKFGSGFAKNETYDDIVEELKRYYDTKRNIFNTIRKHYWRVLLLTVIIVGCIMFTLYGEDLDIIVRLGRKSLVELGTYLEVVKKIRKTLAQR